MSYSSCINCSQMVPSYEKYCSGCLEKYPQLKQDESFWRNYYYTWEAAQKLALEEIAAGAPKTCICGEGEACALPTCGDYPRRVND